MIYLYTRICNALHISKFAFTSLSVENSSPGRLDSLKLELDTPLKTGPARPVPVRSSETRLPGPPSMTAALMPGRDNLGRWQLTVYNQYEAHLRTSLIPLRPKVDRPL